MYLDDKCRCHRGRQSFDLLSRFTFASASSTEVAISKMPSTKARSLLSHPAIERLEARSFLLRIATSSRTPRPRLQECRWCVFARRAGRCGSSGKRILEGGSPVSVNPERGLLRGSVPETHGGIRHLASITRGAYASPSFLERKGVPVSVDDFEHFDCIVTEHQRAEGVWNFRSGLGVKVIDVVGRITVIHIGVARELVIGGVGLGILPNIMCHNDIKPKRLVRVLTDWESPSLQVSATFLGRRKELRRLRAFLDFMERKLKIEGSAGQPLSAIQDTAEMAKT
jgi:LysR substrate binding domain